MKKIYLIVALVFFTTGCFSPKLFNKNVVMNYLKTNYPGEKFTIISSNKIKLEAASGGCDDGGMGNSYKIKSLTSNIEFTLQDDYHFNSFICEYIIEDDYLIKAREKYFANNHDSRIKSYFPFYDYMGIRLQEKDFKTKEELTTFIKKIKTELDSKYPYKNKTMRKKIYIEVEKNNKDYKYYSLKELDNNNNLHDLVYN